MQLRLATLSKDPSSPLPQSPGERSILAAYVSIGIFGGWVCFSAVRNLMNVGSPLTELTLFNFWALLAGATGSIIALRLSTRHFGYSGIRGGFRAAYGALMVSFIGSVIGGSIVMPVYGTMFGPLAFVTTLWAHKMLALFWCMMMIGIHVQFTQYRSERDTIFSPRKPGPTKSQPV